MCDRERDRGVSEVLGYAFIFSLILLSVGIVSVSGLDTLEDARTAEQVENAQQALDVLHNNMEDVYLEGAPSRATEISLGSAWLYMDDNVTVKIGRYDGSWENTTFETRPLIYRFDNHRRLIYVAGAIFQTNRQSGVVMDGPPLVSRSGRLQFTFPFLQAEAVRSIAGATVLVRGEARERTVLVSDASGTYDRVAISVTSPRHSLWQEFFEDRGFDCSVTGDTAECVDDDVSKLSVAVHEIDLSLIR